MLQPVSSHLLSEPVIVCRLARATLGNKHFIDWDKYLRHYDAIRDDIEKTIPGFEQYNKRVREPGGFYLPNAPRQGAFTTPTKKAQFSVVSPESIHLEPGELMMMTIRSHDQFNTTIYGMNDRYRGIYDERRVILLNEKDMQEQNLQKGDVVDLSSHYNGITRTAHRFIVVPYSIPKNCAATYYPETNVLVPIDSVAAKSNTPVSKLVVIRITVAPEQ